MTVLSLALFFLGLALLVAEAHLPSFGLLGAAGVAALASGLVLAVVGAGGSIALALGLAVPVAAGRSGWASWLSAASVLPPGGAPAAARRA